MSDNPFHCSSCGKMSSVRKYSRHCTYKTSRSVFVFYPRKAINNRLIFDIIRCIMSHVSCRIYTRLFIQIIYFQSRIICNRKFPCQFHDRFRFNQCVFFKCRIIFFNINVNSGFFHGYNLNLHIFADFFHFFNFPLIIRCKNNLCHFNLHSAGTLHYTFFFGGFGPKNE